MTIISIDKHALQVAFDVAVNSLDFGSGFLCDDEVTALRAVAVALDVNPMTATPREFKCRYEKKHEPYAQANSKHLCSRCKRSVESEP